MSEPRGSRTSVGGVAAGAGQARQEAGARRAEDFTLCQSLLPRPQSDDVQAKDEAPSLCVLRISTTVLEPRRNGHSDQNAASDYVRFLSSVPVAWRHCFDDIFALDWRHPDDRAYYRHASRKCAEVLVPQRVEPGSADGSLCRRRGAPRLGWRTRDSLCRSHSTPCYSFAEGIGHSMFKALIGDLFESRAQDPGQHGELRRRDGQRHCRTVQDALSGDVRGLQAPERRKDRPPW